MMRGVRSAALGSAARLGVALLLVLSSAAACSTAAPPREARQLGEVWIEEIKGKIGEKRLSEAYQDVSFLERNPDGNVSAERLAELKVSILTQLRADFQVAIDAKDYEQALRVYRSLQGAGVAGELNEWNPAVLMQRIAESRREAGDKPVAFLYGFRAWSAGSSDEALLHLLLELSSELGNSAVFEQVRVSMAERGLEIPEGLSERAPKKARVDQMVLGTVTIWVNRGIRIEGGVGLPDRVIGSGFFVDPRGYLLTNYHVVESEVDPEYEGYSRLYVRLSDRVTEKVPAKVVGYDRVFDLALVKVEVVPKYVFSAAESPELKVGNPIIAIGSPAGLENTVTSGIVSATGRRFLQMGDTVQVDVPINPGNSGGPLLDADGRLVGVVFAGIEQFEGINFAIPYEWVLKSLPRLYTKGENGHPWLGMSLLETDEGLEVVYVVPQEPADRAGIREGDRLVSVNGRSYDKIADLQSELIELGYPTLIGLSWRRGEETLTGSVSTSQRPFSPVELGLKRDRRENVVYPLFGMKIEEVGQFLWRKNYVVRRVLPGSIADETGLSKDDPLSIQGWKVDTKDRYVMMQIYVKKKKSGFLESAVQMAAYLETETFI